MHAGVHVRQLYRTGKRSKKEENGMEETESIREEGNKKGKEQKEKKRIGRKTG